MATEIERKFLVKKAILPVSDRVVHMSQVYLLTDPQRTIRVRITDGQAYLTIKGKNVGFSRPEFEYQIPVEDARELSKLAVHSPVEKDRHIIKIEGHKWEIDFFKGENEGLTLAEIELSSEDEPVDLPDWVEKEVTGDERYHNSYLAEHPFSSWK